MNALSTIQTSLSIYLSNYVYTCACVSACERERTKKKKKKKINLSGCHRRLLLYTKQKKDVIGINLKW